MHARRNRVMESGARQEQPRAPHHGRWADESGLPVVESSRMHFEIVGDVSEIETIAAGRGIRRLKFLRERYGGRHWRKRKGIAIVRLASGSIRQAEVHWYEAHGVGRKGLKIKWFLD